ncbi:TadE/TadG family type IV pilus assembly protein [Thermoflexus sp.]|uniref:TadE/TadG family type IV pilus assembly protein n=1 Tax=Thermoflexus sp. TaxID=1969742 RepID=UPI00260CED92|nr:TadE family protein [Thermoflexus sp.]
MGRGRGQSLVEFALAATVLLILLTGVLDLGRMYMAWVAIQDAAGEGALYAAMNPRCISAANGPDCQTPNNAYDRTLIAIRSTPGTPLDPDRVTIGITPDDPRQICFGTPITVSTRYSFTMITPVMQAMFGPEVALQAYAVQRALNNGSSGCP